MRPSDFPYTLKEASSSGLKFNSRCAENAFWNAALSDSLLIVDLSLSSRTDAEEEGNKKALRVRRACAVPLCPSGPRRFLRAPSEEKVAG